MRLQRVRAAMVTAGLALMLGVGSGTGVRAQSTVEVDVVAFAYQPTELSVPVGTTVVWKNLDPVAHTVTDLEYAYDSGLFEEAGTFSKTFDAPGVYTYFCLPHPTMIARVEVTG
jgi:plastocyanin